MPSSADCSVVYLSCVIYTSLVIRCQIYCEVSTTYTGGKKMPRQADASLERRILDAALKLWNKGGDKALTMRAVATAAGTTTPTLYERFASKRDLRRALRQRAAQALSDVLQPCRSPQEVCEQYLEFALRRPNQYELLFVGWPGHRNDPRPNLEMIKQRFAGWLGGSREEHTGLVLALAALLHGAATVLIAQTISERLSVQLRHSCTAAFATLVENAAAVSGK